MAKNISYLLENLPEGSKTILHGHLGYIAKNEHKQELK